MSASPRYVKNNTGIAGNSTSKSAYVMRFIDYFRFDAGAQCLDAANIRRHRLSCVIRAHALRHDAMPTMPRMSAAEILMRAAAYARLCENVSLCHDDARLRAEASERAHAAHTRGGHAARVRAVIYMSSILKQRKERIKICALMPFQRIRIRVILFAPCCYATTRAAH